MPPRRIRQPFPPVLSGLHVLRHRASLHQLRGIIDKHSSDEDDISEVSIPHLPILTRAQHRRFIEEQQKILQKLIRKYSSDRTVFYTLFDSLRVHDGELEELLGVQDIINEIIFDQTSRTTFIFYSRDIPHVTFTRVRGERSDIPEGPPNFDSNGNEINSEEDFLDSDDSDSSTDDDSSDTRTSTRNESPSPPPDSPPTNAAAAAA